MSSPASQKAVETVDTRPLSVAVRAKDGTFYTTFPYDSATSPTPGITLPESRHTEFSPCGSLFVTIEGEDGVAIVRDAADATPVARCGGKGCSDTPLPVAFASFSPRGSFLLAWARPAAGVSVPNLVVYEARTGRHVAAFHQKNYHIDFWPTIQWTDDETMAARLVTNTVHFFAGDFGDAERPASKLGAPGIVKFSLAPVGTAGDRPAVAAFVGGVGGQAKNAPMKVAVYAHPDDGGAQRRFTSTFRADAVRFMWNARGTACLGLVSTNVDATGENYYGESYVVYMRADGSHCARLDLPKKGPVHDVAWSPTGMEFIVVYGNMPSRATMFDDKGDPVFNFGSGSRNTLAFSPHGRYVALAGFGNLAGAVEFWDKNRTELVGRANLPCTTMMSWSPCSRYFLAATTFPRLRVDNAVRVVRFDGASVFHHEYGKSPLHQAVFRPARRGTYADPRLTSDTMIGGPALQPPATATNGGAAGTLGGGGGGVYRPPGSRGSAPAFRVNEHMKPGKVDRATFMAEVAAATASSGAAKLDNLPSAPGAGAAARQRYVPGMDPELVAPSKAAAARKKKKERQAAKKLEEEQQQKERENEAAKVDDATDIESVEAGEKKVKKLKKKLRAIETLKAGRVDGKQLTNQEEEKLAAQPALEQELKDVERKIAQLSAA